MDNAINESLEVRYTGPIDTRMTVPFVSHLTPIRLGNYCYKGMVVCVTNDSIENNGLWIAKTDNFYYTSRSNPGGWVKLLETTTIVGPTGPIGPTGGLGPTGHQGHQGHQGRDGHQGLVGKEGDDGINGDKGDQGDKGDKEKKEIKEI